MQKTIITLIITLLANLTFAGDPFYPADKISADLKDKAHAVMRLKETTYHLFSLKEVTEKVHIVVTILDEHGQDYATLMVPYDKYTKINNLEGIIFDAKGEKVKRIKKDDR